MSQSLIDVSSIRLTTKIFVTTCIHRKIHVVNTKLVDALKVSGDKTFWVPV